MAGYAVRPVCRHCGLRRSNRPRGLCWSCYCDPAVRRATPSVSAYANRGGDWQESTRERPVAAVPLRCPPGSKGRVAELRGRVERRERLFGNGRDAGWDAWGDRCRPAPEDDGGEGRAAG